MQTFFMLIVKLMASRVYCTCGTFFKLANHNHQESVRMKYSVYLKICATNMVTTAVYQVRFQMICDITWAGPAIDKEKCKKLCVLNYLQTMHTHVYVVKYAVHNCMNRVIAINFLKFIWSHWFFTELVTSSMSMCITNC